MLEPMEQKYIALDKAVIVVIKPRPRYPKEGRARKILEDYYSSLKK